jgi:hypothetical protein
MFLFVKVISNWLILIHFIPFQKYGNKGFEAIFKWLTFPLSCYFASGIFFLTQYVPIESKLVFNPITAGLVMFAIFPWLYNNIVKIGNSIREETLMKSIRLNNIGIKIACICFSICFYIFAIIAVVTSLKFLLLR